MAKVQIIQPKKSPFLEKKKVAAYARVSVEGEKNIHSLNAQVSYFSTLISSRRDWDYAGIFSDYGLTGTKTTRPGFQALIKACDEGKVNMVLAKSISRFARNTVDLLETTRHLRSIGVPVYFQKENINTLSIGGELLMTLLASFAQEEARSISDNTKWAIRKKFENGIFAPHFIMGYRWDVNRQPYIVESEAIIIRNVFKWYLDGLSPADIAKKLNKSGYKSYCGTDFNYSTIWNMLRQEKYTGTAILQKTFCPDFLTKKRHTNNGELSKHIVEEAYPAIISTELFNAVQSEISARRAKGYKLSRGITITCFSGKIKCSECGTSYRRQVKWHKGKDGKRQKEYHYWVCSTRLDKGGLKACPAERIPESALFSMTSFVLKCESFDTSEFNKKIDHITAIKGGILAFHMKEERVIAVRWKKEGKCQK